MTVRNKTPIELAKARLKGQIEQQKIKITNEQATLVGLHVAFDLLEGAEEAAKFAKTFGKKKEKVPFVEFPLDSVKS